jgi:hypothetical protein
MAEKWADLRQATVDAAFGAAGTTPATLRQALARGEAPEDLERLIAKIRREPHRVTDEDLGALRARYSEDQIFEIVLAATVGVAGQKLDAALAALAATEEP